MFNSISKFARKQKWARNAPVIALVVFGGLALETFSVGGIFQVNTATVTIAGAVIGLAFVESAVSVACEMLALMGSMAAAALASDPRPEQRKRAGGARFLACILLVAPVTYLGNSFSYQKQLGEWREYAGSKAEASDQANSVNTMLGEDVMADARENLKKASKPQHASFDFFCFAWAAFLHGALMLAAGVFWRPKDETPAEIKARLSEARAAKAKATRAANLKAAQKEAAKEKPKSNVFAFGK